MYFKTFKDLVITREMHEKYLEVAQNQFQYYKRLLHKNAPEEIKEINYDGLPHGNGMDMDFDRVLMYLQKYESMIELETGTIENLKDLEKELIDKANQLEGIEAKVICLRDIAGMKLQEIADHLGYELGYIKNISSKYKKM